MTNYTIYNASAGAGKTYTLVKNFISVLLKSSKPEILKNILAVTFTNKATNEMKSRIISWLKDFSEANYEQNKILQELSNELNLSIEILHKRAKNTLSYILHHYSLLSISTIDKFNLRLMKSFTKELGLSYSFAVELDATEYLTQSIDELLDQLGSDNPFAQIILEYVFMKFEQEDNVNIKNNLFSSSLTFMGENHLENISGFTEKQFDDFKKLKNTLYKRIKENKKDIAELATKAIQSFQNAGLEVSDFPSGYVGKWFVSLLDEKQQKENFSTIKLQNSSLTKYFENEVLTTKTSKKTAEMQSVFPTLKTIFTELKDKIIRVKIDVSVQSNLITIELQSEIKRFLNEKKEESDVLFLSDVNPIISKHLREEPIAFIYEKLGGRYNHYFIDEFQDTSSLQWNNVFPLIENAKVSAGTSITLVGDPKQSIYRFRGGKPEILIDLMENAKENFIEVKTLEDNYRSLPNVVKFNNEFYKFLSQTMPNDQYKALFGEKAQQNPKQKEGGRVQISFVPKAEEEINYTAEKSLKIVQNSLENGFELKDIVVLVRKKSQGIPIAQLLMQNNIPIITEEALLISSSPEVQMIIGALRWLNESQNLEFLVQMLYWMKEKQRIYFIDFSLEISELIQLPIQKIFTTLRDRYELDLIIENKNFLSFFDYCIELVYRMHFDSDSEIYTSALLDMIFQAEKNGTSGMKDFLEFWDTKGCTTSVHFSDNLNAVKIMTVHKSKGLEFPVVIYPVYPSKNNRDDFWFPLESNLYNGFDKYYTQSKTLIQNTKEEIDEVISRKGNEKQIDDLCVNYVATTRASQQLFIVEQIEANSKNLSALQEFVQEKLGKNFPQEIELYPEQNFLKQKQKEGEPLQSEIIHSEITAWNHSVKISSENKKFYPEEKEEIRHGKIIHELLSQIKTPKEVDVVLRQSILKGIIPEGEKIEIKKQIEKIILHPELGVYFSSNVETINERDFLFEGKIYRPDKLVKTQEGFVIIDFKTGAFLSKHEKQVNRYAEILTSLGKNVKKKLLVYLEKKEVILREVK